MKEATVQQTENRTTAVLLSFLFHAALLAVLILYRFHAGEPITEAPAIVVLDMGGGGDDAALGLPDEGQGDNPAPQGQQMDDPSSTEPVEQPVDDGGASAPPTSGATPPSRTNNQVEVPKNTPTSNDADVAAVRKQQEEARRQRDEQDRIRRQQEEASRLAEAERQRKAQEEADRKRREQEEYNKKKGQFGGTFGSGTGGGRGNTGTPGNQGVPNGTGDNPFGKSPGSGGGTGGGTGTGSGDGIGGGLQGRGVVTRPRPDCEGTGKGKVIVEVTVDASGRVVSASATQRGSTLADSQSRSCAERTARRFVFAPSSAAQQKGTIQVNFGFSQGN